MLNRVALVGRLTRDPEVRVNANNIKVVNFTLAVGRRFKTSDGQEADFIRCVAFNKLAELVEMYVRKGQLISVDGQIRTGSYQNNQGATVYTTDVYCDSVDFLTPKDTNTVKNPYDNNFNKQPSKPFVIDEDPEDSYDGFHMANDDLPF